MMVVNHNLKRKKEAYFSNIAELEALISEPKRKSGVKHPLPKVHSLEELEVYFIEWKHHNEVALSPIILEQAKRKIAEGKRLKYQYHQLLQAKPYSFVAKLMGHSSI